MVLHYGMKVRDDKGDEYMLCQLKDGLLLIAITGFDIGNRWNDKYIKRTDDLPEGWEVLGR